MGYLTLAASDPRYSPARAKTQSQGDTESVHAGDLIWEAEAITGLRATVCIKTYGLWSRFVRGKRTGADQFWPSLIAHGEWGCAVAMAFVSQACSVAGSLGTVIAQSCSSFASGAFAL